MIKSAITINKVWRSEISGLVVFLVLSIICVVVSNNVELTIITGELFQIGNIKVYLSLPILWFFPATYLMTKIIKIYNVVYIVDSRGVEATIGRLALKQFVNRVRYKDIRAIDIHQTILERMLDVGSVEVGTAASADSEIFLDGISSPYQVKDLLERQRDAREPGDSQD